MKWLLTLTILVNLSTSVFAQDSVYGTCAHELKGNDAQSSLFSSIGALKKSNVDHVFDIRALTRYQMTERFVRVVPYADNADRYRKYQVALFVNDEQSLENMNKDNYDSEGIPTDDYIPYALRPIRGQSIIAIGYGGRNQVGGARVTVDVIGTRNGINPAQSFQFDREGKAEFKIEYKVHFNYRDLGGEGIFGIFSGSVDKEDLFQADMDIHKVDVEVKCSVYLNDSVVETSRDLEKDKEDGDTVETGPVSEFSEHEIIRSPRGSGQ